MPLFLDLHKIQSTAREGFEPVPEEILWNKVKGCRCLSSWLDQEKNIFVSLVDAPGKSYLKKRLRRNPENKDHEVIPINCKVAEIFLHRLQQIEALSWNKNSRYRVTNNGEEYKVFLVWYTADPYLLRHRLGEKEFATYYPNFKKIVLNTVCNYQGKELLSQNDCRVISFYSVHNALKCAQKIKEDCCDCGNTIQLKQFLIPGKSGMAKKFEPFPGFYFYAVSNSKIIVASRLRKFCGSSRAQSPFKFFTASEENFLKFLMKVLNQNWQNPSFNCREFCVKAALSKASLYRKCTAVTGRSPNTLIKEYRLLKSLRLMKLGHSITRVGYDVGFNSPSYFSRCFRQEFEIQPGLYRKLCEHVI